MSAESVEDRIKRLEQLIEKLGCRISDLEEINREKTCEIENFALSLKQTKRDIFDIRNTELFSAKSSPIMSPKPMARR